MIVNLRDYYPFYTKDVFVEVDDRIATQMIAWESKETASKRQVYRYHAQYSLDRRDGIEAAILHRGNSPDELYEMRSTYEQLHRAFALLPEMQAKRIKAYYFDRKTVSDIARAEGTGHAAIVKSMQRGMRTLRHILLEKI